MQSLTLPPQTHIGSVQLHVADLRRQLEFYGELLGLKEVARDGQTVSLSATGAHPDLLRLTEIPNARPRPPHTVGLFHIAIRVPSRTELANVIQRLQVSSWPLYGFANHGVSESVYLADAENNGIEIYCDLPREVWPHEGDQLAMTTDPLDVAGVLKLASPDWKGIHKDTVVGHVHLQVSDLKKAKEFYHTFLGFDIVQESYPGALFMSAGGYHHHVATNIWSSRNGKTSPEGSVGLRSFQVVVPDSGTVTAIRNLLSEAGVILDSVAEGETNRIVTDDFDGIGVEIVTSA
jgi:catechol 2,3-dioxygenase